MDENLMRLPDSSKILLLWSKGAYRHVPPSFSIWWNIPGQVEDAFNDQSTNWEKFPSETEELESQHAYYDEDYGGYGSTIKGVGLRPVQNRAVLLKLCLVAASSLYFGGFIAHKGASYLEENEIFVPADDDDDD
ncbi:hypothetical protein ANCCEY_12553 [Ancylostoma ceylanicum]|uniref:Essential MCU regulator, mitochondrial n=1 Tax=Ancylostoma ceylanicum TaxID=53326 RepID=A0A0D6LEM4_9BILA|nr:hypothetical protein ANCCEY_12553 [Ancylostoma ceylanicum]